MSSKAVEAAKRIGQALSRRAAAEALRKQVWREMEPLRRSILTRRETKNAVPKDGVSKGT